MRPVFGETDPRGRPTSKYVPMPPSTPEPHSRAAAESVKPAAGTMRGKVLDALRERPMTEWQLERVLGWSGNTIRPRLWELEKAGLIEKHGEIPGPTGRMTWVYRVVP